MDTNNPNSLPHDDLSDRIDESLGLSDPIALEANLDPTTVNTNNPTIDRSIILGADGRWLSSWALRLIILSGAGYLLWRALGTIWAGVLPLLLALMVATVLYPPVQRLRSYKFPPALAALTTIIGAFAIVGTVFVAIAPSISSQSRALATQATDGITQIQKWIQGPPLNIDSEQINEVSDRIVSYIQQQSSNIASGVFTGVSTASSILVTLILVLVLTFFFLKDGDRFLPMVRRYAGNNAGWHISELCIRIWNTLGGFLRTQAIVSAVDAVLIGIGLIILKVPLALALAVITFFGGFIPIIGAFTAGALAVIIALVSNGLTNAILVLLLVLIVQQIEGNLLQPVLQSKAMNLHAAVILLSVTLGSTLFGIIGAFLAVPIAATIAVVLRYHSELVSLRAGEITIDDIEIATAKETKNTTSGAEAFSAVYSHLAKLAGRRKNTQEPSDEK
ncbi:predicted permease [Corynebacterium kutscheri]|uniref:Predicted permease n=1 Tax=Corynebacterium kutscheri TaxID=35755 RepID=A0A0F6R116_9CORY|nr:AI-2E family transporter [Corynebacterium kutscheri]AKE42047.1 putative permease [Corynebacterium kutscheri]VEH06095.1 predicted permease [Corynebacterium kutscheri]VEH10388.1 predicted permease [Corynebacterium kutscheri]VEH82009.1 predicted permease [Corynebacterium kutscheri]